MSPIFPLESESYREACQRCWVHSRCRAFSLVEMLVVVAIISSLGALSVTAFNSIGRGQKVWVAAGQISDLLDQGRAAALSRSAPIRLGVVTDWPSQPERNLRTIVLLSREQETLPVGWKFESRLWTLAEGVQLKAANGGNREGISLLNGGLTNEMNLQFGGETLTVRFLEFRPNGQIWPELPGQASLLVEESVVEGGDNWAEVLVHPLSGRVSISRPGNP
jgi:prepilin-type N-terminal cleavage/methylation domain-containing protein